MFLFGIAFWSVTYALHWFDQTPTGKSFWLDVTYFGAVNTPGTLLLFVMKFLGRATDQENKKYLWLLIEPILTLIILFTDPYHGLFYGGKRDPMQSQIYTGGIWFWLNIIYTYGMILYVVIFAVVTYLRSSSVFKNQAITVLFGISFPIIGNLITFLGLSPFKGLDLTPIAASMTGLVMIFGAFSSKIFDLVPIGREILVEHLEEGMLLVDKKLRLIDLNPAARRLLNINHDFQPGSYLSPVFGRFPEIETLVLHGTSEPKVLQLPDVENKYIEIKAEGIRDNKYGLLGTLLICSDISSRVMLEKQQQEQMREILALQAILTEQVIRDPLTDLYNRRYLMETLPAEISQASRAAYPLSVVMLDLDHFKVLNDTHGHTAGDMVLVELGKFLRGNTRSSDIVVRYGGEEFLIVLVNSAEEAALAQVERWRMEFPKLEILYEEIPLCCTFSGGIASYPEDGLHADELIQKADAALYKAKAAGRNCTMCYDSPNNPVDPDSL